MQLQVNLDSQVKQIGSELNALLDQLHEGERTEGGDLAAGGDPVRDIAQILGRQMETLQWIDQQSGKGYHTLRKEYRTLRMHCRGRRRHIYAILSLIPFSYASGIKSSCA